MKILWLCNVRFSDKDVSGTGSWLQPLADAVNKTDGYEVVNFTVAACGKFHKETVNGVAQYVAPIRSVRKLQTERAWIKEIGKYVREVEEKEKPDIVQIWGTEGIWAQIFLQGDIQTKCFLDMQGLKFEIARYYMADLRAPELKQFLSLNDMKAPWRFWMYKRHQFKRQGEVERKCLNLMKDISVQSEWVENQIKALNPSANIYHTKIMLRPPFYSSKKWEWHECGDNPIIFTSSSGSRTYKGLHILLQTLAVLKNTYPKVQLRVAGSFMRRSTFGYEGFERYIDKLIDKLNVRDNITFLGVLNANQIIEELLSANVCVVPSFIESYCLGLAEAMMIGTPCVVSFAGAMPCIARCGEEALFYNSQDYATAATMVIRVLNDKDLANMLSMKAQNHRMIDNNPLDVLNTQLEIYKRFLGE